MNNKQFNPADEVEITILEAKRRVFPLVEMKYYKEEELQQGHILIGIARDSECMSILQFEIFIAMFRKIAEIARRKEQEMGCQKGWEDSALPQIEMNFDSACAGAPLYFNINEFDGDISPDDADRFVQVMENLLHQARELMKIDCFHRNRNMPPKY
jgi:hypothetical protein